MPEEPLPNQSEAVISTVEAAPEQYEFTPAEGKSFDPELVKVYETTARKYKLSPESAQGLLNDLSQAFEQRQAPEPPQAPESYELAPPEGQEFDPEFVGKYSEAAKKFNLSQEAAQGLINELSPVLAQQQMARIEAVRQGWTEASTADKEFGGDKLNENLAVAKTALETHGTPELSALLKETGLGNHPEIIRLLYRVGKAQVQDKVVTGHRDGKGSSRTFNDLASRLYSK